MKSLLVVLLLTFSLVKSQEGFKLPENKPISLDFKLINNLIFLPVQVNGVTLTFLLDSGVNETLLFSLENKEVDFNDVEKMKFSGLGENTDIEGLLAINNRVTVGKDFTDNAHRIYIILNESFNFSSHVGIEVNGILGYHFFKNHQIKIDYIKKKITVYPSLAKLRGEKRYSVAPLSIELNKPYVYAQVFQSSGGSDSKMLIDLGNSDAVWLFPALIEGFQYNRPNIEDFLGRGFNGDIYGKRSRINRLALAGFTLQKPLAAMPDPSSIQHLRLVEGRKGSIGSEILRRFSVVIDYSASRILLKPNRHFSDPFHFNMSGLDIKHDGMSWQQDLVRVESPKVGYQTGDEKPHYTATADFKYRFTLRNEYSVAGVRKDSPAFIAGIQAGDKIVKINGKKASEFTLSSMHELFKSSEGKRIIMELETNGAIRKVEFRLEDPIPYQP
ncbi:PDZ domain-containing protein [Planobacterium sp. GCR5]|uniref:PDZ domain-containing protein n=2 Tax=Planobacterium oryzisoli TaxID=2771435 RepID=A0A930YX10_9FLAO|nr:PDZ domain-containing protein [Planobacterium oryzisoli]